MDDAFLAVIVIVSVVALLAAIVALATSRGAYDGIGRGALSLEEEPPAADPALASELRELAHARNARRIARGEAPLDVDAEVSRRLREM